MKKSIKKALSELNIFFNLNFIDLDEEIKYSYINIIFKNLFEILESINALPKEITKDLEFTTFDYLERFYFNENKLIGE